MSTTENGWTKDDPKGDGLYLWRADYMDLEPDVHWVVGEVFYEIGEQSSRVVEGFGGEWLGPFTASDIEQLAALRKVGATSLDWIVKFKELDHNMFHKPRDFESCNEETCREAQSMIAALREALKDRKS